MQNVCYRGCFTNSSSRYDLTSNASVVSILSGNDITVYTAVCKGYYSQYLPTLSPDAHTSVRRSSSAF